MQLCGPSLTLRLGSSVTRQEERTIREPREFKRCDGECTRRDQSRRRGTSEHRHRESLGDDVVHLQQLLHDMLGAGTQVNLEGSDGEIESRKV